MARAKTIKNLYDAKFKTLPFDGVYAEVMGNPETSGAWLIWGAEKHGKTTAAIILSEYLSSMKRVLYISAEEGISLNLVETLKRLNVDIDNRNLHFEEYITLDELDERISKRKSADLIFIDNVTVYADELKNGNLRRLLQKHSSKLFVFLAHEERKEPYTSTAKLIKKLAKIIIYVQGLTCFVSGRCKGGVLVIDEKKAQLYHGTTIEQ